MNENDKGQSIQQCWKQNPNRV